MPRKGPQPDDPMTPEEQADYDIQLGNSFKSQGKTWSGVLKDSNLIVGAGTQRPAALTITYDGKIVVGEGWEVDEAARAVLDAMQKLMRPRPDLRQPADHVKMAEIISDAEIIRVHGQANFGPGITPREVVNEGVRKYAIGYQSGHTQLSILLEHGLITKPRPGSYDANLTKKGKAYARALGDK